MNKTSLTILIAFGLGCFLVGGCILTIGLAFFWRPAPLEGQMEMSLPGADAYKAIHADVPDAAPILLRVTTNRDGDAPGTIRTITLQTPRGMTEIPMKDWRRRLVEEMKQARIDLGGASTVKIESERRLQWASTVEIMEACKEAGFTNVGFGPPPDE